MIPFRRLYLILKTKSGIKSDQSGWGSFLSIFPKPGGLLERPLIVSDQDTWPSDGLFSVKRRVNCDTVYV